MTLRTVLLDELSLADLGLRHCLLYCLKNMGWVVGLVALWVVPPVFDGKLPISAAVNAIVMSTTACSLWCLIAAVGVRHNVSEMLPRRVFIQGNHVIVDSGKQRQDRQLADVWWFEGNSRSDIVAAACGRYEGVVLKLGGEYFCIGDLSESMSLAADLLSMSAARQYFPMSRLQIALFFVALVSFSLILGLSVGTSFSLLSNEFGWVLSLGTLGFLNGCIMTPLVASIWCLRVRFGDDGWVVAGSYLIYCLLGFCYGAIGWVCDIPAVFSSPGEPAHLVAGVVVSGCNLLLCRGVVRTLCQLRVDRMFARSSEITALP